MKTRSKSVLTFAVVAMVTMSFTITTPADAATWDGTTTDWGTASNWITPAAVPGVDDTAIIPVATGTDFDPTVTGDLEFDDGKLDMNNSPGETSVLTVTGNFYLARGTSEISTGNIIGINSTLDVNGVYQKYNVIGEKGTADLTINGAADFLEGLVLGGRSDGVNGSGSGAVTLGPGGTLSVGNDGSISMLLFDGSTLTAAAGSIFTTTGSLDLHNSSNLVLDPAMMTFTVGTDLIHDTGASSFLLPDGAIIGGFLRIGEDAGSTATVTMGSGVFDDTLDVNGTGNYSFIGYNGNASLAVSGTADFDGNLGLGVRHDGVGGSGFGTVTIQTDAKLDVGGILRVYNASSVITGQSGSELTIGSDLELSNGADLDLASDMTLFSVGGYLIQEGTGHSSISLPNGTVITESLRIGYNSNSTATMTIGSGDTVNVNGVANRSEIARQGTAELIIGGTANFLGDLGLGVRHDTVNQSGSGTLTVESTGSLDVGGELQIRGTGGSTFTIKGGAASIEVGGYTQNVATSTLDLDIDSTGISAINVDGAVKLLAAGTLLDVEFVSGYIPAVDDVFNVIINDGTDSVSGIFENLGNVDLFEDATEWFVDSTLGVDTVGLKITYVGAYAGGSDNDVQLIVTSAPASTFTSNETGGGTWSVDSTWDQPATEIPGADNPVEVVEGDLVTVTGAGNVGKSLSITGAGSSVMVSSGASLTVTEGVNVEADATLGGAGTLTGNVAVDLDGIISPGDSVGTLTIDGELTLADGALFEFDLGTASDLVQVTGELSLADLKFSAFDFSAGSGFGAGEYILFDASSIDGSLDGADFSGDVGGLTGTLSLGTGSETVVLTVVPEPNTLVLLATGLLALLLFAWRRKR